MKWLPEMALWIRYWIYVYLHTIILSVLLKTDYIATLLWHVFNKNKVFYIGEMEPIIARLNVQLLCNLVQLIGP